ncbi:hypothetical protein AMJ44_03680 [candidate division WOR-1 bacterium DG_54_3]|uniref:RCK C-terminal domain-containing protein n=1 Tax=candidate division WOR-1 bacterium DG_54_3 TaxID=1703775 RepID=A0A0S7Y4P5_UNCSA|nr:MAG: hypothetical protein AMJ44_03680 [candidate division WOR-1 bacterium DG_54_3]
MNLFLFFFAIVISFIVVRIGAVAFEITGMEKNQARFQSLSCFSGTGFTTSEAELITGHPQRRKIASYLMILGNAGLITLIATFANSIRPVTIIEQFNFFTIPLPIPGWLSPYINIAVIALGVLIIYKIFTKSHLIDRFTGKIKKEMVEKKVVMPEKVTELLAAQEGYGVSQFEVHPDSPLLKKDLKHLHLKEEEIQVLLIQRGSEIIPIPKGGEKFLADDQVICFGKLEKIRQMA